VGTVPVVPPGYEEYARKAVAHYWQTLGAQTSKQGTADADRGNRRAVTGGKQMDGFCELVRWAVAANGMPDASIHLRDKLELPGFFRATKKWDLVVVHKTHLVAAIEFKSQAGPSFGNNFNNRTEEALGNATDISTAFREGAFGVTKAPLLAARSSYRRTLRSRRDWRARVDAVRPSMTSKGY
jgi:hypothetical protein